MLPFRAIAVCLGALVLSACASPTIERPRDGAPVVVGGTPVRVQAEPVPTLVPPPTVAGAGGGTQAGESASPSPSPSGSPGPSPGASPSPSPGAATHAIGATDGRGANLRTGPSTTAPVITTLTEGTPVQPLEEQTAQDGRTWRKVRSGDREGWVLSVVVRPR